MGKLAVKIKATLENVTDLQATGSDFNWTLTSLPAEQFKIKCLSCHEEHPNWIGIDGDELRPLSGSRGEANFVWKCNFCKRESSINHDEAFKRAKAVYTHEDSETHKFVTVAQLDCRGCEIVSFDPKGTWSCKGLESNTPFPEVDLSNDEPDGWNDYDEKSGLPVGVTEFESKVERA